MRGMKWYDEMRHDPVGIRFAFNVALATIIVWYVMDHLANTDPIWAIASMVAASDPQVTQATRMFRSRMINVGVGCIVGLLFLVAGGPAEWKLPIALAVTVLLSSYVIHIQTMWRQAPITAALVLSSGISAHSDLGGIEHGLHKVGEVLFGCLVGLLVSWSMAKLWPLRQPADLRGP
ncbi:MAG: FUSC family protein [Alphaproteobacteria bacterium]|nr:FUSC family protein [Alphaproteobacteria bacterium]